MIDYESLYNSFMSGRMLPFYRVMYPGLLTFASRMLGPSLAFMSEDCVQDAVLSTYEHRDEISDAVHWRWYLLQCIRRRVSNLLRHKEVADNYVSSVNEKIDIDSMLEDDHSYSLMRQETLDTLYAAFERLPELYKEIFRLNFEEGLKNQEIAQLLDIAEITVKKRKAKMLELLRGYLRNDTDVLLLLSVMVSIAEHTVMYTKT